MNVTYDKHRSTSPRPSRDHVPGSEIASGGGDYPKNHRVNLHTSSAFWHVKQRHNNIHYHQ